MADVDIVDSDIFPKYCVYLIMLNIG